jgi:hypothetical protein
MTWMGIVSGCFFAFAASFDDLFYRCSSPRHAHAPCRFSFGNSEGLAGPNTQISRLEGKGRAIAFGDTGEHQLAFRQQHARATGAHARHHVMETAMAKIVIVTAKISVAAAANSGVGGDVGPDQPPSLQP